MRLKLSKGLIIVFIVTIFLVLNYSLQNTQTKAEAATQNCDVSTPLLTQTSEESKLLEFINVYRQQHSLGTLTWSIALKRAAAWQTHDMVANNTFSHIDSLNRNPADRISACGYVWTNTAENIYFGRSEAQAVFTAWQNSPPHNADMLNSNVKEAGIGSEIGPAGNTYWTLDLGSSSVSGPTQPQLSPSTTTSPSVSTSPGVSPSTNPNITSAPSPTNGIITNPTDTKIEVSIKINSIGSTGNSSPKHLTRPVVVGIFDQTNKQVLNGNGFLKYDGKDLFKGTIHLGQLPNDTYFIKIASNYTLISRVIPEFQNLISEDINILPVVTLIQGDLNSDNLVNINDYNLALPCFQNKNCQTKDIIDFNDDGKTDVIDYNLLLSSFHQYAGD